ncbi:MAG: hypothetical protein FWC40_01310 [Proteobacteria bacterium]|nr:hypothetical protein [Pseudomonadota bacterium]
MWFSRTCAAVIAAALLAFGCEASRSEGGDAVSAPALGVERGGLELSGRVIDVSARASDEHEGWGEPYKAVLSDFAEDSRERLIRVSIVIHTSKVGRLVDEDIEERLWNLLLAHAPAPYDLRRAKGMDSHESVWGTLRVEFRRQVVRLRRASKSALQRASYVFDVSMQFRSTGGETGAWDGFRYSYRDEHGADEEQSVNAAFWRELERRIPTLIAEPSGETQHWLRAQGFLSSILSPDEVRRWMTLPEHRYFDEGCLQYTVDGQPHFTHLLSPFAAPRLLSMPLVLAMHCSREAIYVFSQNGQGGVDVYYQPAGSLHAWKTSFSFEEPVTARNFGFHVDDELICVWSGADAASARSFEVQCIDRARGKPRWRTKALPGAWRGFGVLEDSYVVVGDSAVFGVSRPGELLFVQRFESSSSRQHARRSCQSGERLIFSPRPGRVVSFHMRSRTFEWAVDTFDSSVLHCGPDGLVVVSEAGGYLLGMDAETRSPRWKYRSVAFPRDLMSYGHHLYLLMDRGVVVLHAGHGKRVAAFSLPFEATRFIVLGSRIFLDAVDAVYALSASSYAP